MNEIQLKEVILTALKQIAPVSSVNDLEPEDNIRESLDLDSFDHLNFLIDLNSKLGVDIPEKDYGKLNSLANIMDYLSVRVA
jgi:acyl carrier protein